LADSNVRPRASRDYGYEELWQKRWAAAELFTAAARPGDPKYFIVELPPFANGRLHLGHVRNFTLGDVVARFRRAAGWRVHYTTGFDAFGLPIEGTSLSSSIEETLNIGSTVCARQGCRRGDVGQPE
jgi:leucyl-tRNA synthetase